LLNPKKSLGQNFLIDKNICRKIINLTDVYKKEVIEIGPGTGQITDEIIKKNPKKLLLIEKDDKLFILLKKKYRKYEYVKIDNNDALNYDYSSFNNAIIFSNLPYNMSVKLIIHLLKMKKKFSELILMVQKEVAEKMNYRNRKKNNRLSFFIEVVSNYSIKFEISNNVFFPKPKIKSCVIKIKPKNYQKINILRLELFSKEIFKYKRKKISNILNFKNLNKKYEYLINKRAEDLNTADLLILFNEF